MKPPPVPLRRAVIDPLWLPIAVVVASALLAAALAGALGWLFTRRGRVTRLALFGALYVLLDAALMLACLVLWLRTPVPGWRDAERWQDAHTTLLRWVLSSLRAAAGPLLGFAVAVEEPPGSARIAGGPVLVLARHAGPGDSFTLVELLLTRYRRRPRIVLKESLRWDPGLDVILTRLPSCFVPARVPADLPDQLARLSASLHGRDAMLIFPEGGHWTPRRHHRALARLRRARKIQAAADAAENPNVLPPRPAGVLAILAARPDLDVMVVAHTGLDELVSAAQVWRALPVTGRPMRVRWWHEPAGSMPDGAEQRYEWLRLQWALVDSWVGARKAATVAEPESAVIESAVIESAVIESAVIESAVIEPAGIDPIGGQDADPIVGSPG